MIESNFLAYVGPPDLHDGQIIEVVQNGDTVSVLVQAYTGRRFAIEFSGVAEVRAVEPEGMWLYSLTEMTYPPPLRRFVFVNHEDEHASALELLARQFRLSDVVP